MFFNFNQNNSGGRFVRTSMLDADVIVEAKSAEDANARAEALGIYFDGCDAGQDCPCCGDRWYRQSDSKDGDSSPAIYGEKVVLAKDRDPKRDTVVVHYLNGGVKYGRRKAKYQSLAVHDEVQDSPKVKVERQSRAQAFARFRMKDPLAGR